MRAHNFSIRFTEGEWAVLTSQAKSEGRTVGNLIRQQLFSKMIVPLDQRSLSQKQAARDQLLNAMRTRSPR